VICSMLAARCSRTSHYARTGRQSLTTWTGEGGASRPSVCAHQDGEVMWCGPPRAWQNVFGTHRRLLSVVLREYRSPNKKLLRCSTNSRNCCKTLVSNQHSSKPIGGNCVSATIFRAHKR
jgi:hypothetical protein